MTGGWLWVQPRRDGEQHLREEKRGQASHQVIILIAMMTIVMVIMMVVTAIMIMIIVMAVLMITHDYGDDNTWSQPNIGQDENMKLSDPGGWHPSPCMTTSTQQRQMSGPLG